MSMLLLYSDIVEVCNAIEVVKISNRGVFTLLRHVA